MGHMPSFAAMKCFNRVGSWHIGGFFYVLHLLARNSGLAAVWLAG